MSATRPVSSSASHARHMPVSRAARLHADRSGKFFFERQCPYQWHTDGRFSRRCALARRGQSTRAPRPNRSSFGRRGCRGESGAEPADGPEPRRQDAPEPNVGRIGAPAGDGMFWERLSPVLWRPSLPKTGPSRSKSSTSSDGVTALRHLAADLLEMQVHRLGVGIRQDQGRAGIAMRADGAIHGTVWPFANQLRCCRLPGHAVAEPGDAFGPRRWAFSAPAARSWQKAPASGPWTWPR